MGSLAAPRLIYGCGGLGNEFLGEDSVKELLEILKELGVTRLDTAGLYPPTDIGASQRLLGQTGAAGLGFTIDTKVRIAMRGFAGTLEPEKIATSVVASINDLKLKDGQRISTYYAHVWDPATPLKDQAAGFDAQYRKGLFDKVGIYVPKLCHGTKVSARCWANHESHCSSAFVIIQQMCSPSTSKSVSARATSSRVYSRVAIASLIVDMKGLPWTSSASTR